MNVQPSEAEAGFDLRLTPTTDPDEMRRRIAEEWAPAVRNMSYEVRFFFYEINKSYLPFGTLLDWKVSWKNETAS